MLIATAAPAQATTRSFDYTGAEQTFTVPAGVFSVEVLAIGGEGGSERGAEEGGGPAQVIGDLSVTPGEMLYVDVGGNGGFSSPAFNGGGAGGGGGGGASDVRTSPRASGLSPDTRLLVAGGGGGNGEEARLECGAGRGGNAGEAGGEGPSFCGGPPGGGGAGTHSGGGSGGAADPIACRGQQGHLGIGGEGGGCVASGGGGGGGYYGGGGGGAGNFLNENFFGPGGGGGGGGSSLVPPGGSVELASRPGGPHVQISYRNPPAVTTGEASSITQASATLNGTVNPEGGTVTEPEAGNVTDCHFDYGTTASYGSSVPCASLPGSGESPVPVSASIGSLSANTTYHFRVVATNRFGTSRGADRTFKTLPGRIVFGPPHLSFGAQTIGQPSATQWLEVENGGTGPLTFSGKAPISGTNRGDFTIPAGDDFCAGHTLALLEHCFIGVQFTPTAKGQRSATLSFGANNANIIPPQTVALSGIGFGTIVCRNASRAAAICSALFPAGSFTIEGKATTARYRLMRKGRVYRSGHVRVRRGHRIRLLLHVARLRHGRYTLTITTEGHHARALLNVAVQIV